MYLHTYIEEPLTRVGTSVVFAVIGLPACGPIDNVFARPSSIAVFKKKTWSVRLKHVHLAA